MILTEFDATKKAIINPEDIIAPMKDFPRTVITCFARETFKRLLHQFSHEVLTTTTMANMEIPIYVLTIEGTRIGFFNSYVGAAGCVAILEDLIAMGMKNLLVFGTCGVLDATIEETSIIIPRSAIRDEGTSYHYLKASREVAVNQAFLSEMTTFLDKEKISYQIGKVWTTDGIYRETATKMKQRKSQGAICVDMECSAIAAMSQFRGINHAQLFYSADNLDTKVWDERTLSNHADLERKDQIGQLAIRLATTLFEKEKK
ncbi:nucleoside phosphorylase [Streptococcus pacificus]|uniref:Uridine phosphorylase n=1 Tax=Streptococcus pacificus TaxID=2740577 RepID=A0ABS0ZII8_9STRE|nr:nucleoside phosphorylase [Streptococcus pacificus]MBJ8325767.1 nucleoside phosphorylase [Streptococcus pacificus]